MNMKRHLLVLAAVLMTVSAFAQDQQVRFFSHRGGRMEYDENTISAFEASYKADTRKYDQEKLLR